MEYVCDVCGWVYNEEMGDPDNGIEPGTKFADLPEDFTVERRFQMIHDTVASERLDCILAALTNLSREKAQGMIRAGLVEVDFLTEQRPDRAVPEGAMLSVRGYGRYEVIGTDGVTRKGRLRLHAKKFI